MLVLKSKHAGLRAKSWCQDLLGRPPGAVAKTGWCGRQDMRVFVPEHAREAACCCQDMLVLTPRHAGVRAKTCWGVRAKTCWGGRLVLLPRHAGVDMLVLTSRHDAGVRAKTCW